MEKALNHEGFFYIKSRMSIKTDIEQFFQDGFHFPNALLLLARCGIHNDYARFMNAQFIPHKIESRIIRQLNEAWEQLPEDSENQSYAIESNQIDSYSKTKVVRLLKERSNAHAEMAIYAQSGEPDKAYQLASIVLQLTIEINKIYGERKEGATETEILQNETKSEVVKMFKKRMTLIPKLSRAKKANDTELITSIETEISKIDKYLDI